MIMAMRGAMVQRRSGLRETRFEKSMKEALLPVLGEVLKMRHNK
jgi:hypothetical protein